MMFPGHRQQAVIKVFMHRRVHPQRQKGREDAHQGAHKGRMS
jgi:hypothetical protein